MTYSEQQRLDALIAIEGRFRAKHCADRPADAPPLVRLTDVGRHAA